MTLIRSLYERFRHLIGEAAKFGVVGAVGVLITNGGYGILHNTLGIGPVTSTTFATIVATAASFVANRYWSFRHRQRTGVARETVIFFILNGLALLIQDAVVAFNFYILGNHHSKAAGFIALNVGIALATLFRFWSYRKWVWLAPGAPAAVQKNWLQSTGDRVSHPGDPMTARLGEWQDMHRRKGDGSAPDLLHTTGNRSRDQSAQTRPSGFDGWES